MQRRIRNKENGIICIKSCDVCWKTVSKGSVPNVRLEKMPLIDKPFKSVAIDLVGPISPPSEEGHRYILTLVDFSTRYPEAVPLKNIDTETVAEALVDIFSRLGVPEEILTDLGTQFVSDCMREVTRLLSIKQLTTTPYHRVKTLGVWLSTDPVITMKENYNEKLTKLKAALG